jgi:O-antigen/teichoic acid export membrane protein
MTGSVAQAMSSSWNRLREHLSPARSKVLTGMGWQGLGQVVNLSIRFCSNVILTRLLTPRDYGIFGTALAVITTLEMLSDLGIWPSLVRHPGGAAPDYLRTGWWIGLMRSSALTVGVALLAWPLSAVYKQPEMFLVLLVLSLRCALFALRSPGMFLARRNLDYRPIFIDEVTATLVGTAISLTLAFWFRSVWAIVAGTLAGTLASVVTTNLLRPIGLKWDWNRSAALEIAHLGRQIFINTLVAALRVNLDRLLGGRLLPVEQIGYYVVALNLVLILEAFVGRACDVYFSSLAHYPDSETKAAQSRLVLDRLARWAMPVMALGIVAAPTVISVLYDARYAGARPLFAILFARVMFVGLARVQFQYLLSLGEIRINTRAHAVATTAQILMLIPLTRSWGVNGLAVSSLAASFIYAGFQAGLLSLRGDGRLRPFLITLAYAAAGLLILANLS